MRAYSLDLRKKVMAAYHKTQHKSQVCKQFSIARSTLDAWIALEAETRTLTPLPSTRHGRPFTIRDMESFKEFVQTTPFSQISELLVPFEQKFGYQISYTVLWRGLNKIGWNKKQRNKIKALT